MLEVWVFSHQYQDGKQYGQPCVFTKPTACAPYPAEGFGIFDCGGSLHDIYSILPVKGCRAALSCFAVQASRIRVV